MKIEGERIYIRTLEVADAQAMVDLQMRNKEFFQKYSPLRRDEYYTLEYHKNVILDNILKFENDEKYSFGIFINGTNELIGTLNLTEISRGPAESCMLGYSLDSEHNGKGYMTEAVKLAVKFAFEKLNLHRIEAGVMPHNIASMTVLEKVGFKKEGIARKNVKIKGEWQDHQMLAVLSTDLI